MRELTMQEMEQVDGGVVPLGVGIALAVGVGGGAIVGGWRGALVGGLFSVPAAIFAGVATATTGAASAVFAVYSVGTSLLGAHATSEVSREDTDS